MIKPPSNSFFSEISSCHRFFIELYQYIQSRVIKKSEQNFRPYDVTIMSSGRYDVVMKVLQLTLQKLMTSAETFDQIVQNIAINVKTYVTTF